MKHKLFFLIFVALPIVSLGQDLIIKNSGENIQCKINKVDSLTIFFSVTKQGTIIDSYLSMNEIKTYRYGGASAYQEFVDKRFCFTAGFLQGGGSLVGFDFEALVAPQIGLQAGFGFLGVGAGLNIHTKPRINSSAVSIQYWHQGINETYIWSLAGATYMFRARKIFTAQLGLAFVLEEGPAVPTDFVVPPAMLMYAIGIYLPF